MRTKVAKANKLPVSRFVIYPYSAVSESARDLAKGLSHKLNATVRRIREKGEYVPTDRSIILNYGNGRLPPGFRRAKKVFNFNVLAAANKLSAFRAFKDSKLPTVDWTTNKDMATQWIKEGNVVLCRTMLNGHSGHGIVIARKITELVNAPLYTKYKKKKKEYRVHVFNNEVIDAVEKRKKLDQEKLEDNKALIRSHDNGWAFCRDGVKIPIELKTLAINACSALALDFGAVDIIWNGKDDKFYLLEVNTAPGLEGTTLTKYVEAIYKCLL